MLLTSDSIAIELVFTSHPSETVSTVLDHKLSVCVLVCVHM